MAKERLYVNNETLGNVEYIGTRYEWLKAMRVVGEQWWADAVIEAEEKGEQPPTFGAYMDDLLIFGLVEATAEKMTLDRVVP